MTMHEDVRDRPDAGLDRALAAAFAFVPPPAAVGAVEQRIDLAIERARQGTGHRGRVGLRARLAGRVIHSSRRGRAAVLVAAVLVLGAAGPLLGVYEGMVGSFDGWKTAWDRGTVVGVSKTIDGYEVTLERVYADPGQVMVAVSVNDLAGRGWTQVAAMGVAVTDEQGRPFGNSMGMSHPEGSSAAANVAWLVPPAGLAPGRHTLHVSVPAISVRDNTTPPPSESSGAVQEGDSWTPWHDVSGPWTFTIPVDVPGGSTAQPNAAATIGTTEVRLTQVTVAPTSVNATVAVRSAGAGGSWAPVGQFEHGGQTYPLILSSGDGSDGTVTVQALAGTATPSGDWTLRIDELVGSAASDGSQVRLAGPWVIGFSMP